MVPFRRIFSINSQELVHSAVLVTMVTLRAEAVVNTLCTLPPESSQGFRTGELFL